MAERGFHHYVFGNYVKLQRRFFSHVFLVVMNIRFIFAHNILCYTKIYLS